MEYSISDFAQWIESGNAVATFGQTPHVQPVWDRSHALVIELGARAAYPLLFGWEVDPLT